MEELNTFYHQGLKNIAFSPDEKYSISYNGDLHYAPTSEVLFFWLIQEFHCLENGERTQVAFLPSRERRILEQLQIFPLFLLPGPWVQQPNPNLRAAFASAG